MLGVYLRLFSLLEEACHKPDIAAVIQNSHAGGSYEQYVQAALTRSQLEHERLRVQEEIANLEQLLTLTLVQQLQSATGLPLYQHLQSSLSEKKNGLTELVRNNIH